MKNNKPEIEVNVICRNDEGAYQRFLKFIVDSFFNDLEQYGGDYFNNGKSERNDHR